MIGTGIGGVLTLLGEDHVLQRFGARRVSPRTVPMLMTNGAAAALSIEFGAKAGTYTPVSACASGAEAIAAGARLIRAGEADVVIAGGTEAAITAITLAAFAQIGALSKRGDPEFASRPFDRDRDGFVLGEGAGVMVLERADRASARGKRARIVLNGAGITSDAFHLTSPHPQGEGQSNAMKAALRQAGLHGGDIRHVNCHATGTATGDLAEARSIRQTLGPSPVLTAPKASLGHLVGAGGAVEAIVTVLSMRNELIPPTRNLENVSPEIDLDIVTGSARSGPIEAAITNSFGFGGQNVSLLFTMR
ncbi:Beta-ketoacyl synthase [Arthrobacter nitrophenolicus]|uniref:Beta-ketoacyl synthase n=1 Tax=Arthrobacter nitrophenolicus TaxID=683150 RepID=L8TNE4_9MICC|nr:Beta-ketoacyl synthase [Arthrobacter nitrophenolicus]